MKPGHVEILGEIDLERPDAVFFHEGDKQRGAWLPRADIQVFKDDPVPGLVSVWMPVEMATAHGFYAGEAVR